MLTFWGNEDLRKQIRDGFVGIKSLVYDQDAYAHDGYREKEESYMKNIIIILKSVITPVYIIFLCVAGFVSSLISFTVEYFTMESLFLNTELMSIWKINTALFITIIFEVVKNGCCILFPSLKKKDLSCIIRLGLFGFA